MSDPQNKYWYAISQHLFPCLGVEYVGAALRPLGDLVVNGRLHLPLQVLAQQVGRIHLKKREKIGTYYSVHYFPVPLQTW